MTISVLIPTRNRPESLERTLRALGRQERLPDEVLIVDASDLPADEGTLRAAHPDLAIACTHVSPGLCAQRNLGVRMVRGSHVLLCDDDIEPPSDYVSRLAEYLDANPSEGAVTGMLCEPDSSGSFAPGFPVPTYRRLLFATLFQLTVWADVEAARGGHLSAPGLPMLKRWYRRRGNSWSLAGWPLVTQVEGPVLHTTIYGLGASLVRRDWLLASPFDERLGTHGIGDNYGVALGFPEQPGVAVLVDLPVLHYRAVEGRLDPAETYLQRVLALDYFMRTSCRFSPSSSRWLAWSLVGNIVAYTLRGRRDLLGRTITALGLVLTARNPLLEGRVREPGLATPSTAGPSVR